LRADAGDPGVSPGGPPGGGWAIPQVVHRQRPRDGGRRAARGDGWSRGMNGRAGGAHRARSRREGDGSGRPRRGRHHACRPEEQRVTLSLERKRIRISAGEMAYVDMGEGRPVVLLHGFPTSAHLWRREAWLLAQRMRVLVPDLMGYGESDQPLDAELSERAQAGYVGELL